MKRVLVVDDSASIRETLRMILDLEGYDTVAEAENGKIAIDLYREHKPDIVVMDINMPVMNGIEAMRALKEIDGGLKVILISGEGDHFLKEKADWEMLDGFITKPFGMAAIVELFQGVIG